MSSIGVPTGCVGIFSVCVSAQRALSTVCWCLLCSWCVVAVQVGVLSGLCPDTCDLGGLLQ